MLVYTSGLADPIHFCFLRQLLTEFAFSRLTYLPNSRLLSLACPGPLSVGIFFTQNFYPKFHNLKTNLLLTGLSSTDPRIWSLSRRTLKLPSTIPSPYFLKLSMFHWFPCFTGLCNFGMSLKFTPRSYPQEHWPGFGHLRSRGDLAGGLPDSAPLLPSRSHGGSLPDSAPGGSSGGGGGGLGAGHSGPVQLRPRGLSFRVGHRLRSTCDSLAGQSPQPLGASAPSSVKGGKSWKQKP